MKRDKSEYAIARETYRVHFPGSKMHHMHPKAQNGPDCEFNLFPWNAKSHSAWHDLFSIMTVQEVFPILRSAHTLIFDTDKEEFVCEWCLPYQFKVKKDVQLDMLALKNVTMLREAWFYCFGASDLRSARRVVKYMMLFIIFGRYADGSEEIYRDKVLQKLLASVPETGTRAWAFEHCFGCSLRRIQLSKAKRVIEQVRANAQGLVVR